MDCSYYSLTVICVYPGISEYENRLYEAICESRISLAAVTDRNNEPGYELQMLGQVACKLVVLILELLSLKIEVRRLRLPH
jgi:hypothetical protein